MSAEPVVIICVRDPDASNDFTVYGAPEPTIIDVDLGYMNLDDPVEFMEWLEDLIARTRTLPEGHPAGDQLREIALEAIERHHPRAVELAESWITGD
jgi:hypothetical protein